MEVFKFSGSTLSLLKECPRCFYLHIVHKFHRPRGPFPSLPGGFDREIKKWIDVSRGSNQKLPEILAGQLPVGTRLEISLETIKKWRHWKSGLQYREGDVTVIGALDDCLTLVPGPTPTGRLAPIDYKTKGKEPADSGARWYQVQMDVYALLLSTVTDNVSERGFLAYFWPESVSNLSHWIPLNTNRPVSAEQQDKIFSALGCKVYDIPCSAERAKALIAQAIDVLSGEIPKAHQNCEYCACLSDYGDIIGGDKDGAEKK